MIKTIRLELLRHGPSHNQLLSPLTPYLALCDNHPPETVHVEFEHGRFLLMGEELSVIANQTRAIDEVSAEVTRLLGSVRSLQTQIPQQLENNEIVHLRLVLTSAELAMLPFELAKAPNGYNGAGQWLLRNPTLRICLTRETRRSVPRTDRWSWPSRPRILFARGPDIPDHLAQAHMLALRRAVDPWLGWWKKESGGIGAEVKDYVTVLDHLSFESLRKVNEKNRDRPFTHLHVLAHGAELPQRHRMDLRFGLHAWRSFGAGTEVLDATQIHGALVGCRAREREQFSVITLATCDSAHELGAVFPGANLAHELHEKGYPLIVASQLPLSFEASVVEVETFYKEILCGIDPRVALQNTRDAVATRVPATHDWAGMVAYASLPDDVDAAVKEAALNTLKRRGDAAVGRIHVTLEEHSELSLPLLPPSEVLDPSRAFSELHLCCDRLDDVFETFETRLAAANGASVDEVTFLKRWMFSLLERLTDVFSLREPAISRTIRLRQPEAGAPTGVRGGLSTFTEPEILLYTAAIGAPDERIPSGIRELVGWYEQGRTLELLALDGSLRRRPRKDKSWSSLAKSTHSFYDSTAGSNDYNELSLLRLRLLACVEGAPPGDDATKRKSEIEDLQAKLVDAVRRLGTESLEAFKVTRSLHRLARRYDGTDAAKVARHVADVLIKQHSVKSWWGESVSRKK